MLESAILSRKQAAPTLTGSAASLRQPADVIKLLSAKDSSAMNAHIRDPLCLTPWLIVLFSGVTWSHEFKVTPHLVSGDQALSFQWKIDGAPAGVPWVNIFTAGSIDDEQQLWDYWKVASPRQGQRRYDPARGIRPQKGPFPLEAGKYVAILRMWKTAGGWGEVIGIAHFEVVGQLENAWAKLGYHWKHYAGDMRPFPATASVPAVPDPDAPVWAYLQFRMRRALGNLARLYMSYHPVPPQGAITTYNDSTWHMGWWPDYVALTGDTQVRDYCYAWRDSFIHSVDNNIGNFSKGYVKKGDIDHQNEDIVRFLSRLQVIDATDEANNHAVRRMAPLLGNWVGGVPAWYDYQRHAWRSLWLGTEFVDPQQPTTGSAAFSWLCLLALRAHQATADARYLQLVEDFCAHQAADIRQRGIKNPYLSFAIFNSDGGTPLTAGGYGHIWGVGAWQRGSFRLCGGLLSVYTNLYQLTGKPQYRQAAATFIDHTVPDMLYHTRGMSAIGQVLHYRRVTGDRRADDAFLQWIEQTRDRVDTLHAITEPTNASDRKTDWLHGCETRNSPSPKVFNMAHLISGDERYLDRAVEMALDRVRAIYAEEYRPATRQKSPGDWNWFSYIMAWEVADAFFPTVGKQYVGSDEGLDLYEVRFFHADGKPGLPREVAAQYLPESGSFKQRRLKFYNASDNAISVRARPTDTHPIGIDRITGRDAAAAHTQDNDVVVNIPPHRTLRLTIHLNRTAAPTQ